MTGRHLARALLLTAVAASGAAQEAAAPSAADPRQVVGAPRGRPLAGAPLVQATERLAALLRCPVCQGLSVQDSPTSLAQAMKAQVRDLLAAGYDDEQALAYFEGSYGEFVLLKPPRRGVNWLVWIAPGLALLGGGLVLLRSMRKLRGDSRASADTGGPGGAMPVPGGAADRLPTAETLPDDPALAPYVLRVRELAYGWPGGVRPRREGETS